MFLRVVWILLAMLPLCAQVKVWEDTLTVPTYVAGPPDKNPFFYTGRTYQGARGEVYPYPMYDNLTDRVENKAYKALYLENEYVKICVLPELGGRQDQRLRFLLSPDRSQARAHRHVGRLDLRRR